MSLSLTLFIYLTLSLYFSCYQVQVNFLYCFSMLTSLHVDIHITRHSITRLGITFTGPLSTGAVPPAFYLQDELGSFWSSASSSSSSSLVPIGPLTSYSASLTSSLSSSSSSASSSSSSNAVPLVADVPTIGMYGAGSIAFVRICHAALVNTTAANNESSSSSSSSSSSLASSLHPFAIVPNTTRCAAQTSVLQNGVFVTRVRWAPFVANHSDFAWQILSARPAIAVGVVPSVSSQGGSFINGSMSGASMYASEPSQLSAPAVANVSGANGRMQYAVVIKQD
jgi:hypothetical protein